MKILFWFISFMICFTFFLAEQNTNYYVEPKHGDPSIEFNSAVGIDTYNSSGEKIVQYFYSRPQRVIVDEVNTLETLLALGVSDSIIGISIQESSISYQKLLLKYPEEIKKIKNIYKNGLDQETALALQPDFILGWKSSFSCSKLRSSDWWNENGVKTYIVSTSNHLLKYGTVEDECKFITDMGKIFGVEERANKIVNKINSELRLKNIHSKEKQSVMVVELRGRGFSNYDDGWIVGDMVKRLGGNMPVKSKTLGYEELIEFNPDVIFVVNFNDYQKNVIIKIFDEPKLSSLKAVKNKRVYTIPFYCMYTPAVRVLEGIEIIKYGMYPKLKEVGDM